MARSAKVTAIEALSNFRGSLLEFEHSVRSVLETLSSQANRGAEWIETDRTLYWPQQVRERGEQLGEAQNRLAYRQMIKVGDHQPACDEEKKQVRLAKARLQEAHDKLELVQHWRRVIRHEAHEFNSRLGKLRRWLDSDLPRAISALEQMHAALGRYAQRGAGASVAPPIGPANVDTEIESPDEGSPSRSAETEADRDDL